MSVERNDGGSGVVRKPHPDLAALIAKELEVRRGSTQTWGEHIASAVAEWLTSPETATRVEAELNEVLDMEPIIPSELVAIAEALPDGRGIDLVLFAAGLGAAVWVPEDPQ